MSEPIIELKEVGKTFTINKNATTSLKTALLFWRNRELVNRNVLEGISISVNQGESVAFIGRNGAGKSTLLSIIAGVYKPTIGTCTVRAKVAPLLELGAGFHPDMTGYDNLTINAMCMGLTKKQLSERRDSIIEFSGLEEYISQPIRKYSSGMVARLGFSIVAHVDADVLIVDEVLAVGDGKFQEKCHEFLSGFSAKGGTLLFVSHAEHSVHHFAERSIWIDKGKIKMDGQTHEVSQAYRDFFSGEN